MAYHEQVAFFSEWLLGRRITEPPLDTVAISESDLHRWSSVEQERKDALRHAKKNGLPSLPDCSVRNLLIDCESLSSFGPLGQLFAGKETGPECVRLLAPPERLVLGSAGMITGTFEIWGCDWAPHDAPLPKASRYLFRKCPGVGQIGDEAVANIKNALRSKLAASFAAVTLSFEDCPIEKIDIDPREMSHPDYFLALKISGAGLLGSRSILDMAARVAGIKKTFPETAALILGERVFSKDVTEIEGIRRPGAALYIKEIGWDENLDRAAKILGRNGVQVKLPSTAPMRGVARRKAGVLDW